MMSKLQDDSETEYVIGISGFLSIPLDDRCNKIPFETDHIVLYSCPLSPPLFTLGKQAFCMWHSGSCMSAQNVVACANGVHARRPEGGQRGGKGGKRERERERERGGGGKEGEREEGEAGGTTPITFRLQNLLK
jgi:hypothetical protein